MMRAGLTCCLLIACAARTADAQLRAITRDGDRLGELRLPITPPTYDLDNVTIDPDLRLIVDQLGSDEFAQREEATAALQHGAFEHVQIYALLARQPLNAEQRHRLLSYIVVQLASTPRGAVGIAMEPGRPGIGELGHVIVTRLIPGFDAAQKLEFRDRITHVDGQPLNLQSDFVRLVQSKKPGESVTLAVQRAARDANGNVIVNNGAVVYDSLEIDIVLGSLQDLEDKPESGNVLRAEDHPVSNELRWVLREFGAPVGTIEVNGEIPAPSIDHVYRTPVDEHPAIALLLRQLEDREMGLIDDDAFQRQRIMWQRALNQVRDAARQEGISEAERRYRFEVAYRLSEIFELVFTEPAAPELDE